MDETEETLIGFDCTRSRAATSLAQKKGKKPSGIGERFIFSAGGEIMVGGGRGKKQKRQNQKRERERERERETRTKGRGWCSVRHCFFSDLIKRGREGISLGCMEYLFTGTHMSVLGIDLQCFRCCSNHY